MLEQITGFLLSLQAEVELDFISRNILTKKKITLLIYFSMGEDHIWYFILQFSLLLCCANVYEPLVSRRIL